MNKIDTRLKCYGGSDAECKDSEYIPNMAREIIEEDRIETFLGRDMPYFANSLVKQMDEGKKELKCTFNGVDFEVTPGMSVEDILECYNKRSEEQQKAFSESPEGIQAIKKMEEYEEQVKKNQEETNQLVENLSSLDFSDSESVLEWVTAFLKARGTS
jgi:hypothetical protein